MHLVTEDMEADQFQAYHDADWNIESGDKPGLCILCDEDFDESNVKRPVLEADEGPYGAQHYILRPCPEDPVADVLANCATQRARKAGGLIRQFSRSDGVARQF
jgi:hypothetical protein